jgi:uncharacterized protein (DUF736 family)
MAKSALIIGSFTATETGFMGKVDTLAVKAAVTFERQQDKQKDNHPDYIALSGGKEIGVAWERSDDRGHYVSVSFEEPGPRPLHTGQKRRGKRLHAHLSQADAKERGQKVSALARVTAARLRLRAITGKSNPQITSPGRSGRFKARRTSCYPEECSYAA